MFIDYVGLMLINMAIGLVTLAWCVYRSSDAPAERGWAAAFFAVSVPALACGFHMIFTWPLPGSYNTAYGELSVLLGTLFLAAGISTSAGWSLRPLFPYAFLSGAVAVEVGVKIVAMGLTQKPLLSGFGFAATGLGGMLLPVAALSRNRAWRALAAMSLAAGAAVWLYTGLLAYWGHLESFVKWVPPSMR